MSYQVDSMSLLAFLCPETDLPAGELVWVHALFVLLGNEAC